MTDIAASKIDAYRATSYHVQWDGQDVVMKIGVASPELLALFAADKTAGAAYVTAFNPQGSAQSDSSNAMANRFLIDDIVQAGYRFFAGSSCADDASWAPEASYLILGIALDEAKMLGARYRQDAIVWVALDGVPELILLR